MAQKLLILGAGRSSSALIEYLLKKNKESGYTLQLVDQNEELLSPYKAIYGIETLRLNALNKSEIFPFIKNSALVVSMLPAHLHIEIAKWCLETSTHLATASYLSPEMKALDNEAKRKGLVFLNECGLDPGLDHMSAMRAIDRIKAKGNIIRDFESFTGGLLAPESENPPWNYKFTWNPRNVVLAGSGGAVKFIQEGRYKYIPYHRVFRRTEIIEIPNYGRFEGYANRDSLKYRETYGLENVQTMYRGTLRRPGYCKAWNCLVQLGATDDSYIIVNSENLSPRQFINTFLAYHPTDSVELKLRQYLKIDQDDVDLWEWLEKLDLFSEDYKIGVPNATPAQILQHILLRKWEMKAEDKDMIVMWHKFKYVEEGETKVLNTYFVKKGISKSNTAMAQTVGLPLGVASNKILSGEIKKYGTILPIYPEIYNPVLDELEAYGIVFE